MAVTERATTDIIDELTAWLEENWDPDLTCAEWWERLGLSGWAAPTLPENAYGKALSRNDGVRVQTEIARFGALGALRASACCSPLPRSPRTARKSRSTLREGHRHRATGLVSVVQ